MEAFFHSFALVVVSEIGDKTQLLALVLALRFKKPLAVMSGILVATLLNHGLATAVGGWIGSQFSDQTLKISLALIFFAFSLWILIPDKLDEDQGAETGNQASAFLTTLVLFFFAEMGDKTQLATVALGAKFQNAVSVTAGTTMGMLLADGLAVIFGEKLTKVIPMAAIRYASAALFALFGAAILWSWA